MTRDNNEERKENEAERSVFARRGTASDAEPLSSKDISESNHKQKEESKNES